MVLLASCTARDVRRGRRLLQRGDAAGALVAFTAAAEAAPTEGARWLELARAALVAQRYGVAREAFGRLAALRPRDPRPLVEIGFTWELERAYARALEAYGDAIERAPRSAYAHRAL
ncbi:MAG: tetratricopeptide repeat protein, partial [Myxococcota bacterium]